jgi:hypothetical protein
MQTAKSSRRGLGRTGETMSDTQQNIVNSLQQRRHDLMMRVTRLQAIAQRAAFYAVTEDSWKARQQFRDAEAEADRLANEVTMLDLALAEAYARLQSRGRECATVMQELGLMTGENNK